MSQQSPDRFIYQRTVSFGECDAARVLYTPRAVDYAVEAVEGFFEKAAGVSWAELAQRHGLEVSFRTTSCDYLRPMVAGQELRLQVRLLQLGDDLLDLDVAVERSPDEPVFRARFGVGFTSVAGRAAVAVPSAIRERLLEYREVPPSLGGGPTGSRGDGQQHIPPCPPFESGVTRDCNVPFCRTVRIRYGECGMSGGIYLPKLIESVVERVGEWYQSFLGITWLNQCISGRGVPFINIRCDCLRPILAGDTLTLAVRIPRLGNSSIVYQVAGYGEDGAPVFVTELLACYIVEQPDGPYQVTPFPDHLRRRVLEYQGRC